MLMSWTRLIARTALGILVVLNGQADALARDLFPARPASCCASQSSEATVESPAEGKNCCCECCRESGQSEGDTKTKAKPAEGANDDSTSAMNPCCPRGPGCPGCPAGGCGCCTAKAPFVILGALFSLELAFVSDFRCDFCFIAPDANPQELILPPRA